MSKKKKDKVQKLLVSDSLNPGFKTKEHKGKGKNKYVCGSRIKLIKAK